MARSVKHAHITSSYLKVSEQIVHGRLDVKRVEPQSEHARLALSFSIKVLDALCDNRRFLERLQAWVGVEQVGDKGQVQARVTRYERRWCEVLSASDTFCVVQNLLSATGEVCRLERSARALIRLELVQEYGVVFSILDVLAEVLDTAS